MCGGLPRVVGEGSALQILLRRLPDLHLPADMRYANRIIIVVIALTVVFCWFAFHEIVLQSYSPRKLVRNTMMDPKKKVVIYAATRFFGMEITTERFLSKCRSTAGFCRISSNPADLNISDAILFHNADFSSEAVPLARNPSRPHILWSLESPTNDYFKPGPHFVNWTMTFRRDADIWYPYGHFRELKYSKSIDFDEIWKSKNSAKTAAWLASNCFTMNMRTNLIDAMQNKGLKIDRYGRCGSPPPECDGVDKQQHPCVVELLRPYKFYIALENSNCIDYVTEKFYESLISRMTVPIVLKRKTYVDIGAPPTSFIALDDFETLDDMIKFVNEVAIDKEKYLKYHTWRSSIEAIPEHNDETGFCELCRRLQLNSLGFTSYPDVRQWHANNQCDNYYGNHYLRK
ncbi:hypothetical protein Angca_005790 [Angiostrongylus cantonensis]|nr:hypothetical protein Angca_005790 [Angiostrongylus cantonensis]